MISLMTTSKLNIQKKLYKMKNNFLRFRQIVSSLLVVGILVLSSGIGSVAEAAVADTIYFQGRLLSGPQTPAANLDVDMRFSFWPSADFVDGVDVNGAGALVGAAWEEVISTTTDEQGFLIAEIGSVTPLPAFDSASHRFLQTEVKSSGQSDTEYFILDSKLSDEAVDRKGLENSAYAQNASRLAGKQVGFGADAIPYLDANGKLDRTIITEDSWLDAVADLTALNALTGLNAGDTAYVTAEGKVYTYNGSVWGEIGTDLSAEVTENTGGVALNFAAIESNGTDISANAAKILINEESIGINSDDIIANSNSITSQQESITADEIGIQNNDSAISDNATAIQAISWKAPVANTAALTATYPSPEDGWTAYVSDVKKIYSYDGSGWADMTASISVPVATESVTGTVTLSSDAGTTAGEVVQANDSRLAQVATNTGNISTNSTSISNNSTNITSNDADIQDNYDDIQTNLTSIGNNDTDILNNANAISAITWKATVANAAALPTTYPTPAEGWTAYVSDVDEIYSFDGSTWVDITGSVSVPNATETVFGTVLLSSDAGTTAGEVVQANDSRLAQVATNTGNISNNDTDIATNTSDISTLESFVSDGYDVYVLP